METIANTAENNLKIALAAVEVRQVLLDRLYDNLSAIRDVNAEIIGWQLDTVDYDELERFVMPARLPDGQPGAFFEKLGEEAATWKGGEIPMPC